MIWTEVVPGEGPPIRVGADTEPRYVRLEIGNAQVRLDVLSCPELLAAIAGTVEFQRMRIDRTQISNANRRSPP